MAKQSDLRKRMNQLGKVYSKQTEIKRYQQALRNADYEDTERRRKNREAIQLSRQVQKQIGKSKAGRALMGLTYGFNTNLAPLSYSKKASDLGYKAYTPTAASAEIGDTSKKTAEFNKQLEASKAYKYGSTAGNIGATALSFLLAGGPTKGIANKVLKTKPLQAATTGASNYFLKKLAKDQTGKSLSRKFFTRVAANTVGRTTPAAVENAAKSTVRKVAENITQDAVADSTVGLYRDLATARANDVDIKDPKQLAPYLGRQALWNTVIGSMTNAGGPVIKGIGKSKKFYRTVEKLGPDGLTYKVKELKPQRVISTRNALGEATDIISPSLRRHGRRNLESAASTFKNLAKEADDVIPTKPTAPKLKTTELSSIDLGNQKVLVNRAVNKPVKSAWKLNSPDSADVFVRNAQGRKILHSASADDLIRANDIRRAANVADVVADQADDIKYRDDYIPKRDINDLNYAKQLNNDAAERHMMNKYGMDAGEYAKQNNMQRSAVLRMAKDEIAEDLGLPELSEAQRKSFADSLNPKETPAVKQAAQANSDVNTEVAKNIDAEKTPEYTHQDYMNDIQTLNGKNNPTPEQRQAATDRLTQYYRSKNQANNTQPAQATTGTDKIDPTMGGTRSGVQGEESQAVKTIARQRGNTKEEIKEIENSLRENNLNWKYSHSNKDLINEATTKIQKSGLDKSRAGLREIYDTNGRWSDVHDVECQILQNRYTQIERAARAAGDTEAMEQAIKARDEVTAILAQERSEAGKALQAGKAFSKLSPEGRVNAILMMKNRIQTKTGIKNIEPDGDLLDMLHDAKNEDDLAYLQDQLAINIWDQVPATLTEKFAAWRYMAMLMNPKTHIRNIMGNTIFGVPRGVANILSAGLQRALVKEGDRTRSLMLGTPLSKLSKQDQLLINKGLLDWDSVKNKFYGDAVKIDEVAKRVEGSKVFKTKFLQWLSDFNSKKLNQEDEYFAKRAYANAYAQYLKANKINLATASEKALDAARNNAWDEALIATYRENNALATLINKGRKWSNISLRDIKNAGGEKAFEMAGEKAIGTAIDVMLPFVKTPANIMKEGLYYSPAGLVRMAYHILNASDPKHVVKAIDSFSQAVSGSTLFGLGMWLAHKGAAKSSMEFGDNDKDYYDYDRGMQEYSLTIGNNTLKKMDWFDLLNSSRGDDVNVTVDSLAPAAMPFFEGVELYNALFGENGSQDDISDKASRVGRVFSNIPKLADPVFGMSMLSSLRESLERSKDEDGSFASAMLSSTLQSRIGQYVPTVLSQVTKTLDEGQRSQDSVQTGSLKSWDKFLKQQMNKVPGVSKLNPLKRDVYGNIKEQKTSTKDYVQSALKNALSPVNIKRIRNDKVDKELQARVEAGASTEDVLPSRRGASQMSKSFEGFDFKIGAKELTEYNETRGKYIHSDLKKLFKSEEYKDASNEGKVDLIKDVYNKATDKADKDFALSQGVDEYDYDYKSLSDSAKERYDQKLKDLKATGSKLSKEQYMKIYNKMGEYYGRDDNKYNNNTYVARTLDAIKLGVRKFDEAKVASNADKYGTTWTKAVNLYNRGVSADKAYKYAMTEDERLKCCNTDKYGTHTLDRNKLALYINQMKIPQAEKWARFEVNRTKSMSNPF